MRAYERLLRYVNYDTASDENSPTCPSTAKQLALGRALVEEMLALGIRDARIDEHGYVYGSIPANVDRPVPAVGLIAHMDVVDVVPSADIKPRLVENYDGGDVVLKAAQGIVLSPATFPELRRYTGKTLIVTDGTTLLGADDKAGIADILTLCEQLLQNPALPHGKICIGFTPDEEIGRGADLFDIPGFGADVAYTLDGGTFGEVECENFNAAAATVTVTGQSVHPGSAKHRMVSAAELAIRFHTMLPAAEKPEYTEGYEGFYHLTDFTGDVPSATLHYILRDHDAAKLTQKKQVMHAAAAALNAQYEGEPVQLEIRDSYRNMKEYITDPTVVESAREAIRRCGVEPSSPAIRGGTDGARLTEMGLPCPNLGTGGHNYHGCLEYAVVEEMDQSVEMLMKLVQLYTE